MKLKLDYINGKHFGEYWAVVEKFYHSKFMSDEYPRHLINFLKSTGAKNIIDASCGIGEPSLKLIEQGFSIDCSDGNKEMLEICKRKASEKKLSAHIFHSKWQDLPSKVNKMYDAVLCLDSSITYINTWGKEHATIDIKSAHLNILKSVKAFYEILKNNGIVIIGLAKYAFGNKKKFICDFGEKYIENTRVHHIWKINWDLSTKTKYWELIFYFNNKSYARKLQSYMLMPDELTEILKKNGFSNIKIVEIEPKEYDQNFMARKIK